MEIKRLTPKPEMCEAVRFDMTEDTDQERIADWCGGSLRGMRLSARDRIIQIDGLDGEMDANFGDWIVREASGRFRVLPDLEIRKLFDGLPAPEDDSPSL